MKYLILLLLSFNAYAGDALITWTAPIARENGDDLASSEISGYKLFCYQAIERVVNQSIPNVTAFTITLPSGTYGCRMITIDTDGRQSIRSNATKFTIVSSPPNPPVMQ